MDYQPIHKKILTAIQAAKNILLLTHRQPDGDALGSAGALADYLKKINKPYQVFDFDEIPPHFYFLPDIERLLARTKQPNNFDLMIVLDCGAPKLTGWAKIDSEKNVPLINIDHHSSNSHYGDLNLVVKEAAATAEIITGLLRQAPTSIDRLAATYLLAGIVSDTNNFTNQATGFSALQTASFLMDQGAKLPIIASHIFKNKSLNGLRFWGQALDRLKYNQSLGLASTVITRQDFKLYDLAEKDVEGLANFLINYSTPRLVMVLRELANNKIKGSLRTTDDSVDVARLAETLGGGGHKKAAAFIIDGQLRQSQGGWEVI
ncbi:MAG: DHH family phosphoesterase [bacterium]